ncbi:solute carrier family 2 (facilitated glucose transporter), member 5, isoform CRA_b [Mus musculus]|nr:solute carrier family 2 (facilitated glucose transporter), member 5, isoform CRA_b [Mus musculus]
MEEKHQEETGELTLVLALATLIAAFGSSFQYGYNVAAVNSPSEFMQQFYNDTYYDRNEENIESFTLTLLWSLTVSMFPFGGFIGSLMVGTLVNKLGRKGALLFNNIFSILPAILMGCSQIAQSFELIIISRLLVGICAGISSNVVPMYLGELAPKNLRGALGVVPQLFITVGILIYYYADQIYLSAGVKSDDVQYVTAGTGAVNVFMTILTIFVVELWGRRFLLLVGFSTCLIACLVLTAALALQNTISWMPYISIVCVIVYVIGHALGPSPIPALLITEIFLQSSRPAAYMIGGSVHWLSNFTVGLIFPFIQMGLGPYSFIIFATICFLTTIYIFMVVPETKGRTFIEINQIFTMKNKVSDVYPKKEEELGALPHAILEQ